MRQTVAARPRLDEPAEARGRDGGNLLRVGGMAVVALGIALRVVLALVNDSANDDHLSVIEVIARQHRIPRAHELAQAYHPPLYHLTVAELWRIGPWETDRSLLLTAQLVSGASGIATLFLARAFIRRQLASPSTQLLALSLVALNPKLIGLNAQATNDSFVVLFGTLSLYFAWVFLRTGAAPTFGLMVASCVLAALSKGSGIVVYLVLVAVLGVAALRGASWPSTSRPRLALLTGAFSVAFALLFITTGPYRSNYEDSGGRLVAINVPADPLPSLVRETYVRRPGTTSVVDTYLTFRLVDLLRHPVLPPNGEGPYPRHRTSLWSQLHGRLSSIHFDQWPPAWQDARGVTLAVVRSSLILGLVPSVLLLAGLVRGLGMAASVVARARDKLIGESLDTLLFTTTVLGFLLFIVVFTARYRDFASMKVEYLFPALLGAVFLFMSGTERVATRLRPFVTGAILPLLVVYVLDVGILVQRLT
jgi:hypothetical protein